MPTINLKPTLHSVFNEFDSQGILLGLSRLEKEKNPEYKQRLFDIFVRRANSTYLGLINGITRELGLKISQSLSIVPVKDTNGIPLATNPGIVFQDTKCIIYEDFCNNIILLTVDRFEATNGNFTIGQLITTINNTGKYLATLLPDGIQDKRSMTIFNQSSVNIVPFEDISNAGIRVRLDNNNIIPGTVSVTSNNLLVRRTDNSDNLLSGEYFVDLSSGTIFTAQVPSPGSLVRYKYREDNFLVETSPVIVHDVQSSDFRTKMFEQLCTNLGVECNGLPTVLGADLINELLSVFPSSYGI